MKEVFCECSFENWGKHHTEATSVVLGWLGFAKKPKTLGTAEVTIKRKMAKRCETAGIVSVWGATV